LGKKHEENAVLGQGGAGSVLTFFAPTPSKKVQY